MPKARHALKTGRPLIAILLGLMLAAVADAQPVVEYLGNEGVRVELGDTSLLIDALWDDDYGRYERVPPDLLAEITRAEGRFGEVDFFLVTHRHGDHFDADLIAGFLERNTSCTLLSSKEVVDLVRRSDAWTPLLEERVLEIDVEPGESLRVLNLAEGTIDATWVLHGGEDNRNVVNLAFRVETPEGSIVHTGDADAATAKAFLSGTRADVAFVAFWQFLLPEGDGTIEASPDIKRFVGVHIPEDATRYEEALKASSELTVLAEPGETVRF